jgi:hypothetical protein
VYLGEAALNNRVDFTNLISARKFELDFSGSEVGPVLGKCAAP